MKLVLVHKIELEYGIVLEYDGLDEDMQKAFNDGTDIEITCDTELGYQVVFPHKKLNPLRR